MIPGGLLFVCLGNSCRSIMAEALARHLLGGKVPVASAGLDPLGYIAPLTLEVLAETGVSLKGLYSKGLKDLPFKDFGRLINLSYHPVPSWLTRNWPVEVVNRPVSDPFGGTLEDYRRTREEIRRLLTEELLRDLG
jgi:protein-tyrosine-phosphatase